MVFEDRFFAWNISLQKRNFRARHSIRLFKKLLLNFTKFIIVNWIYVCEKITNSYITNVMIDSIIGHTEFRREGFKVMVVEAVLSNAISFYPALLRSLLLLLNPNRFGSDRETFSLFLRYARCSLRNRDGPLASGLLRLPVLVLTCFVHPVGFYSIHIVHAIAFLVIVRQAIWPVRYGRMRHSPRDKILGRTQTITAILHGNNTRFTYRARRRIDGVIRNDRWWIAYACFEGWQRAGRGGRDKRAKREF